MLDIVPERVLTGKWETSSVSISVIGEQYQGDERNLKVEVNISLFYTAFAMKFC